METHNTYQVKDWANVFEGSRSKAYNNKTTCQMPTKHGLGFKKLIKSKNGPAMFGAWCAMIQVLSRHPKPRVGYCTEDGTANGKPYSPADLELLTYIPESVFDSMLQLCATQDIGWLVTVQCQCGDSAVSVRCPLDLDLDLDSDLDSDSDFDNAWELFGKYGNKKKSLTYWRKLTDADKAEIMVAIPKYLLVVEAGRRKKQFEGWINPENKIWQTDWDQILAEWTKDNKPKDVPRLKYEDRMSMSGDDVARWHKERGIQDPMKRGQQ